MPLNAFPVTLDPPFLLLAPSRPQVKGSKPPELGERVILWKGRDQALMESFFFFNLINKRLILHFVMLREEEEEGRKVRHRISPWQSGESPGALCPASLHVTPGIEYFGCPALRRRCYLTAQSSLRSWKGKEVSSPALPRARNQRTWPGISRDARRPHAEYRGARARRGAAPAGGPAWHVTRPRPGACNQSCPPRS